MGLSKETDVPLVETAFFPFSGTMTTRIGPVQALSQEMVRESLLPNVITEIYVAGHPWKVAAVLSPYTPLFHVMLLDSSKRYMPDPTFLSPQEGDGLMKIWQRIVSFQEGLKGTKAINVGYNWSPRSYGEAEEKGGFQSLTTKWHLQFWNQPESAQSVPLDSLKEETRRVILGNSLNKWFGVFINEHMLKNNASFNRFLDLGRAVIDNRGIEISARGNLKEIFARPGFFSEFLQPLAVYLDRMARDITECFSTLDNSRLEKLIKGEFEEGANGALPILREDPHLLPYDERTRKIQFLGEKGYSNKVLNLLMHLNSLVKEKADAPDNRWFRKGLGYALVFSQDLESEKTRMRIMPGIFVEDRGGVVEALGIALYRREGIDSSQEEKNKGKRMMLKKLGEYLRNS